MGLSGEQVDAFNQPLASRSEEPEKAKRPTFTQQRKKFSAKKIASSPQRSSGKNDGPSQVEINALLAQYESRLLISTAK
jgi:hypothetical protein